MNRTTFFLIIILSTLLASCNSINATPDYQATFQPEITQTEAGNTLIVTDNFTAIILTKEFLDFHAPAISPVEYWTPEVRQVLFLESKLGEYVTQNASKFSSGHAPSVEELTQYGRQYYGVAYKEIIDLRVIFLCPSFIQNRDWHNLAHISSHGGGDCFFGAFYDMQTQEFIDFGVSSPK